MRLNTFVTELVAKLVIEIAATIDAQLAARSDVGGQPV